MWFSDKSLKWSIERIVYPPILNVNVCMFIMYLIYEKAKLRIDRDTTT
jgi:hypothetical protein